MIMLEGSQQTNTDEDKENVFIPQDYEAVAPPYKYGRKNKNYKNPTFSSSIFNISPQKENSRCEVKEWKLAQHSNTQIENLQKVGYCKEANILKENKTLKNLEKVRLYEAMGDKIQRKIKLRKKMNKLAKTGDLKEIINFAKYLQKFKFSENSVLNNQKKRTKPN